MIDRDNPVDPPLMKLDGATGEVSCVCGCGHYRKALEELADRAHGWISLDDVERIARAALDTTSLASPKEQAR